MIMLMLKYKTHIEFFPLVYIVKEFNNDEFKSSIAKSNRYLFVPEYISVNIV